MPNPRVGDRQQTCGAPECRRARHRRKDRAWHARNPDYDRGRRWQKKQAQAAQSGKVEPPDKPPLSGLPWDQAQDAIEVQTLVIIIELAKVLVRHAQDEISRQVLVFNGKSGRHGGTGAQDEIGRKGPAG